MSSHILEGFARSLLAEHAEPFVELIRQGNDLGARDLILQIQTEHPYATAFLKSIFSGTPAEVVEAFAAWWPDVREVPNVERFAAALQRRVWVEWNKPRPFLPPRRRP
jgi:hypothetical protein